MIGCFRGCSFLVYLFLAFLFVICIGEPTVVAIRERARIADAVEGAKSIDLVQYNGDMGLNPPILYDSRKLTKPEFDGVLDAMPLRPDLGLWGTEKMCLFDPHHKIVTTDARGKQTVIRVCFVCDQIQVNDGPIISTPYLWRKSLRSYFVQQGLPDKSYVTYHHDLEKELDERKKRGGK